MARKGGNPDLVKHQWKKGQSGNPAGPMPLKDRIERMKADLGHYPRTELMRIANDGRAKLETRVRCLIHLDEQFTGKAKQSVDWAGSLNVKRTLDDFYRDEAPKLLNGKSKSLPS